MQNQLEIGNPLQSPALLLLQSFKSQLQVGNFVWCYMNNLSKRNGAQFKFHLPGVFIRLFVLRLEHLAVQITLTIKYSSRFQIFLHCITTIHFALTSWANFLSQLHIKVSRRVNYPPLSLQLISICSKMSFIISAYKNNWCLKKFTEISFEKP